MTLPKQSPLKVSPAMHLSVVFCLAHRHRLPGQALFVGRQANSLAF